VKTCVSVGIKKSQRGVKEKLLNRGERALSLCSLAHCCENYELAPAQAFFSLENPAVQSINNSKYLFSTQIYVLGAEKDVTPQPPCTQRVS
jgi:hypothetical protein